MGYLSLAAFLLFSSSAPRGKVPSVCVPHEATALASIGFGFFTLISSPCSISTAVKPGAAAEKTVPWGTRALERHPVWAPAQDVEAAPDIARRRLFLEQKLSLWKIQSRPAFLALGDANKKWRVVETTRGIPSPSSALISAEAAGLDSPSNYVSFGGTLAPADGAAYSTVPIGTRT